VQAKVAVHSIEQGGINIGLGGFFRRVRFAADPDRLPQLQHRSGSLDAGVRLRHHHLRQALAAPRYILQLAEQPRDVRNLPVHIRLSTRTAGRALSSTAGRRLSVMKASALELVMAAEIDDLPSHENMHPL
jgi:hypothetical protein